MRNQSEKPLRLARVFVGSSSASLQMARKLKVELAAIVPEAAVTVWDEAFRPGQLLLEQIVGLVHEYDFGVFVFAGDDVLLIRGPSRGRGRESSKVTVRDNVLFEAGVFMGGLGHERTFLVVPRGLGSRLRTPSDLEGLLTANYQTPKRQKKGTTPEADVVVAAREIGNRIRELGAAPRSVYDELQALRQTLHENEFKDGKRRLVVLEDMVVFAAGARRLRWHTGVDPMDVMSPILKKWGNAATDTA